MRGSPIFYWLILVLDVGMGQNHLFQWPFQDPKMEVPTIYKAYKAYVRGYTPENMAKHMVRLRTSILGSWGSPIDYYHILEYNNHGI